MNSVLKYPGAKNRLAKWILQYIPEHEVYLEPFFGSGAIFFNKEPAKVETVNDLDSEIVNYFKVIRDYPSELLQKIKMTPYARDEYENAFIEDPADDNIEKARKFIVRCYQGFGCSNRYKNGFRSSQQKNSPQTAKLWDEFPEVITIASERLKRAQIENLPAIELINRYNTKDVFIYADPPYLHGTRKGYLYKHEMTNQEHVELLEALLKNPGKVLLSGYDSELYNAMLSGWNKVSKDTQVENGLKRTEVLWMNYQPQMRMFF